MSDINPVNIPKIININIEHTDKLDRTITFTTPLKNDNLAVSISYCKNTNNVQLKLNSYLNGENLIQDDSLFEFRIYRNLDNSNICRKYLELEDITNKSVDFKKKFKYLRKNTDINLMNMMREVYNFSPTNRYENSITVYGWYVKELGPKDYQFFLIERKRFDKKSKVTYLRTAAIELGFSDVMFSLGV